MAFCNFEHCVGPKEFKDRRSLFQADHDFLAHLCATTLHFGPRSGENIFHIGFKQDVKTWKPRNSNDKQKVMTRKDRIKAAFKVNGMPIFEVAMADMGLVFHVQAKVTRILGLPTSSTYLSNC